MTGPEAVRRGAFRPAVALAVVLAAAPPFAPATAAADEAAADQDPGTTATVGPGARDGGDAAPATTTVQAGDEAAKKDEGPALTARARYNAGLELLRAGDHEAAAEAFLRARDEAGPDPELRYRAAFNLGLALAFGAGIATSDGTETGPAPAPECAARRRGRSRETRAQPRTGSGRWPRSGEARRGSRTRCASPLRATTTRG